MIVEKRVENIKDELTDKASALMNMAYAIGLTIAPIMGGELTDNFSYEETAALLGTFCLLCGLLNFFVIFGPKMFGRERQAEKEGRKWSIHSAPVSIFAPQI